MAGAVALSVSAWAHGPYRTVPVQPQSPKKRQREITLDRARREKIPLKVRLPTYLPTPGKTSKTLDPELPAKKMPPFSECGVAAAAAALRRLEPDVPVKKHITEYYSVDPPRNAGMLTPPGLMPAPR